MHAQPDAPFLIAEIGCNHGGSLDVAREMTRVAAQFCGVPCVKFQKRCPRGVLTPEEYARPHPDPAHAYGPTYGAHREFLELDLAQHRELKHYCEEVGTAYACSVWDLQSAGEIAALNPWMIKIPSACNTHFELLGMLCAEFGGKLHLSLGMTRRDVIDGIVDFFRNAGRAQDLVLYHCVSGYPVRHDDVHLLEIARLRERYGADVGGIGYSGHHLGIALDVAAYALGATWFERHFTLDRTQRGTDHAASLEPDGLRRVWRDLNAAHRAMTPKPPGVLEVEEPQRRKLKWDRNR